MACGQSFDLLQLVAGINRALGTNIEPILAPPRAGDVRESLADISLAQKLLDYQPTVGFDEGLARTIEYYRELAGRK